MTYPRTVPRSAIEAVFRPRSPVASLGRAAWLYLALLSAASDRGVVIRTRKHFAKMLSVSEPTLEVREYRAHHNQVPLAILDHLPQILVW
jgi:hypothetical protein